MSESEEAFESADEDVDESKGKRRGRTTSEKLSDIKETESPVRDCRGKGDEPSSQAKPTGVSTEKSAPEAVDDDAKASAEPKKEDAAETNVKEKEMSVFERLAQVASRDDKSSPINWGFGKWGSSILSTAATSVSTFTNQVSQGIGTVIETVESTLGAPSPEELAQESENAKVEAQPDSSSGLGLPDADHSKAGQPEEKQDSSGVSGIFSGVTAITKAIEATSSKVLSGGLDTLEMIGKKTMDILTEGDPGLRKKRAMFEGKTSLSEVLREAKLKAEKEAEERKAEESEDMVNYSKLFDEHQGLVHLEALEMLCGERKTAVQQKLMEAGEEEKAELNALLEKIKKTCESLPAADDTPDDELEQEFEKLVTGHLSEIGLNLRGEKLKETDLEVREWLRECMARQEKGKKWTPRRFIGEGLKHWLR
uniref:Protein FAM114A2 n=1 Tax=Amblyomma triste TaxID=251400 RepID=A0A023GC15_AMBTT